MGTKTITTAEMNFFQARQRVRKKLGTNTTGNAHCPTTSAELCGGPRPGREMDKAPNTTPFTTLRDDMDHPRSDHERERASGPWREPPPHPHGAPLCEHPGVDPSIGGRTGTCACGAAFKQSRAAVSYYEKMGYGPRFRCFVCSAAQRLRRKQAPLRPARTPSPTPVQPPAAAAADLQLAAGQAVVDLPSALSTLCAQVCAARDELDALTTRLAKLHAALVAPTKKKKKKKTARTDPSPDPATPPPTPVNPIAGPIADSSPVPSREPLPTPPSPIADPSPASSREPPTAPPSPIANPAHAAYIAHLATYPTLHELYRRSCQASVAKFRATPRCPDLDAASSAAHGAYIAHITSGAGQIELIHDLLYGLRRSAASAISYHEQYAVPVEDIRLVFDESAEELAGHLMNKEAPPDLCSALGIAQPAWTKPSPWAHSTHVPNTKQGEAILMAFGIAAPATILTAIHHQCRSGSPFVCSEGAAPQQLRELHAALAALKPHAT